jgi:hypothetical protein
MSAQVDAICLVLFLLVAANIIGVAGYALKTRLSVRRDRQDAASVAKAISEYFRKSGVPVTVDCTRMPRSRDFAVAIESEPMKRFRLSHIIESTLRDHVRKTCSLEVAKVYWRFPIKDTAQTPAANPDDYINEGLEHYRHIPPPEVTELPWEQYEKMTTIQPVATLPEKAESAQQ